MNHASPDPNNGNILPSYGARLARLESLLDGVPMSSDISVPVMARVMSGLTEEQLTRLCEEARRLAANNQRQEVTASDFEEATFALLQAGAWLLLLDADENRQLALEASARALVAWHNPVLGELRQITLLDSRTPVRIAKASAVTKDASQERGWLVARLDMLLAGEVGAAMFPGTADREEDGSREAAEVARQIVVSSQRGNGGANNHNGWWARLQALTRASSNGLTAQEVEELCRQLVSERRAAVRKLVETHREALEFFIEILLHEETVDGATFERIMTSDRWSDDAEEMV